MQTTDNANDKQVSGSYWQCCEVIEIQVIEIHIKNTLLFVFCILLTFKMYFVFCISITFFSVICI